MQARFPVVVITIMIGVWLAVELCGASPAGAQVAPTILWDGAHLARVKAAWKKGDQTYARELATITEEAQCELAHEPYTVVARARPKDTAYDPNDYYSEGLYWWPDPKTPVGLPYIRRDGEVNPESAYCRKDLGDFIKAVRNLSLAAYFTDEEKFAARAALFIRAWFLDEKTRMNPNLRHAQAVPGRCTGRSSGLIDTARMRELVDAMQVLSLSPSWPEEEQKAVKVWFDKFLRWFLESKAGKEEAGGKNNLGTWYRQQVALYAVYVGREELAKPFFDSSLERLLTSQVKPDGRQPLELKRVRAMTYCLFNLQAWEDIATLSRHFSEDYWNVGTPIGSRLKAGIDYLVPYADPASQWHQAHAERTHYWPVLAQASFHYGEPKYREAIRKLPPVTEDHAWWRLVYSETP